MEHERLLQPNPSNPREMEEFMKVPDRDRQAWLHFVQDALQKEDLGIAPTYTFDKFEHAVAPNIPNTLPILDLLATNGLGNGPLVPNFAEPYPVSHKHGEYVVEPMLSAFDKTRSRIHTALKQGPLAVIFPHTSLATPYAGGRSVLETIGKENSHKLFIVIGPRPAVMQFEHFNQETGRITSIKPVELGQAIAQLVMTGPNTDSTRNNPDLADWLKALRTDFWLALDEIMEPKENGENNIVVFCPAGRVALQNAQKNKSREYRVDGKFDYLTKYKQLGVLPVGAYDQLLVDAQAPESIVILNPDIHVWNPRNDNEAQFLHERAVELSASPVGGLGIENIGMQNLRLAGQRIRRIRGKISVAPYLSE